MASCRQQHRYKAAERRPEGNEPVNFKIGEQSLDILNIGERHIGHDIFGVSAVSPAPEIEGKDTPVW